MCETEVEKEREREILCVCVQYVGVCMHTTLLI